MECDTMVSTNLQLRTSPASIGLIPGILAKGVKVMLFAGDEDLICNYKGIERTIASLEWADAQGLGVSLLSGYSKTIPSYADDVPDTVPRCARMVCQRDVCRDLAGEKGFDLCQGK